MNGRLAGKRALITGGGSGIGLAIARAFAREGANLFLVGRTTSKLELAAELTGAQVLAVDLTESGGPARALDAAHEALGYVDTLVNSAATFCWRPYVALTEEDWRTSLETNLTVPHVLSHAFATRLIGEGRTGSAINLGSIHGTVADGNVVPQCATKLGLVGLSRATAEALRPYGIRVNVISPGSVEPGSADRLSTDLTAKITQADVAALAVYLASDEAAAITGADLPAYGITRPVVASAPKRKAQ